MSATSPQPRPGEIEPLLDAAEACLQRFGLAKMTVEDVAQAAGVSRATVYRQVGNRDALVLAVAVRDAERTAAEAVAELRGFDSIGDWIVEGLLFCLREIPRRPVLGALVAPREVGAASRMVLTSSRLIEIGSSVLRPIFERARADGLLRADVELDAFMEWILRILLSYLAAPGPEDRTEADMRRLLRQMLLPAVLASSASSQSA